MNPDPQPPSATDPRPRIPRDGCSRWSKAFAALGWCAAVGLAFLAAFFARQTFSARWEAGALRNELDFARIDSVSLRHQNEAERILAARQIADLQAANDVGQLQLAQLAPLPAGPDQPANAATAIVAWNPASREGVLVADGLAVLSPGETYAVWLRSAAETLSVHAGAFAAESDGSARTTLRAPDFPSAPAEIAITRETYQDATPHAPSDTVVLRGSF